MFPPIKIVIHQPYGGFSLTDAIVEKLREMGSHLAQELTPECRFEGLGWLHGREGEPGYEKTFRAHPDLVKVVEELTEEVKKAPSWEERLKQERELLNGLVVATLDISIEIEECEGSEIVRLRGTYG